MPKDTLDELITEVKSEIKTGYEKLEGKHEDLQSALTELKKDAMSEESFKARDTELTAEIKKISEAMDELDTKLSRPKKGSDQVAETIGKSVIDSDVFKALQKKGSGSTGLIETKAITNAGNAVAGQTLDALVPRDHLAGIVGLPDQPLTIRDLLPTGVTGSNSIEYVKETGFTNNAGTLAENTISAESDLTFSLENAPVRTIAHHMLASKLALDDAPMLMGYIDMRLRYGQAYEEEQQLLLGDNTGQNLNGVNTQAIAFNQSVAANGIPGGVAASNVDIIRWAKLQVRQALYPATAIVLNPQDWAEIELLKDANDNYLFSAFTGGAEPRLWGLRVVESDSIAVGSWLTGAFQLGAQVWDRQRAGVEISTEDGDNFRKGMITVRAEERLALTVYRPASFMKGTFSLVA